VWLRLPVVANDIVIECGTQLQAYTSTDVNTPETPIHVSFATDIAIGQILTVNSKQGTGEVKADGEPQLVSILNQTGAAFATGISSGHNFSKDIVRMCTMPLFGSDLKVVLPTVKAFLMVSGATVEVGTVLTHSSGPGVIVELSEDHERTLSYDIDAGWSWGGGCLGKQRSTDDGFSSDTDAAHAKSFGRSRQATGRRRTAGSRSIKSRRDRRCLAGEPGSTLSESSTRVQDREDRIARAMRDHLERGENRCSRTST
jgi:hypothetical protein